MSYQRWKSCLFAAATIACLPFVGNAQVVVWKPGQTTFGKQDVPKSARTAYGWEQPQQIDLYAAAEPSPALKYRFWVSPSQRNPGNVNAMLSRAMLMFLQIEDRDALDQERSKMVWEDDSLSALQVDELKTYLDQHDQILKQIHHATELDTITPARSLKHMSISELIALPLNETRQLRSLAGLLDDESRLAVIELRYEDAIRSIRSQYRLAEVAMTSSDQATIGKLVAISILWVANGMVERLSQQTDTPNLYWALASVPNNFWKAGNTLEAELDLQDYVFFGILHDSHEKTISEDDWDAYWREAARAIVGLGRTDDDNLRIESEFIGGVILALFGDRSKHELLDSGVRSEAVREMSISEAIIRAARLNFVHLKHDMLKWSLLQNQAPGPFIALRTRDYRNSLNNRISFESLIHDYMLPAFSMVMQTCMRGESEHALLLTQEALRAYAASHEGKLPESLSDLTELPAWDDPVTGQPFEYHRDTEFTATLRCGELTGLLPSEFHLTMHP